MLQGTIHVCTVAGQAMPIQTEMFNLSLQYFD